MRSPGKSTCIAVACAISMIVPLAACTFHPPASGDRPDGAAPGDDDAPPPDAIDAPPPPPPDARLCFGAGIGMLCLTSAPAEPKILSGAINTGDAAQCTEVVDVGGVSVCVVAGTTIDVATGATYQATGTRPLALVATGVMQIEGTLSAGSVRGQNPGAGAATAACAGQLAPENDIGGAGGGAGGSFTGKGGDGGTGDLNLSAGFDGTGAGGRAGPAIATTKIRGGCSGGNGGSAGGSASNIGVGGPGGGAIYLISGTEIRISGEVSAFGAGGGGGDEQAGGGGGGSGGMIGIDAPLIALSGVVTANGGGGGEGGGLDGPRGVAGGDGTRNAQRALGGVAPQDDGGSHDGGNGGLGSGGNVGTGSNGGSDNGGAGGGGGAAGYIYVIGTYAESGIVSPAADVHPI